MELAILPLAIGMIAGPQILSALLFITAQRPIQTSLAYISAFLAALVSGLVVAWLLFHTIFAGVQLGEHKQNAILKIIQLALVGVLIALAIRSYITRHTSKPPKWLARLSGTQPGRAFRIGWLLVWLTPSDLLIMATVTSDIVRRQQGLIDAWPFVATVAVLISLPLVAYLLFHKKLQGNMQRIREGIATYSWAVNTGVYLLFAFIILS